MENTQELGKSGIFKLILNFSGPAMVGMMVMSIYNIVDRIYIGQAMGPPGIAGVAVGYPLVMVRIALTLLVAIGAASLVSIRLGENRRKEAEQVLGNAITMFFFIALLITPASLLFLEPLLRLFGASDAVLPYAMDYMRIIAAGSAFPMISFGGNHIIRAEGNPRFAMYTLLIGAVINIILDPILIFALDMGMAGAAYATVIAQAASALWVIGYFLRGHSLLRVVPVNFRMKPKLAGNIISIGTAPFFKELANSLIMILLNNCLLLYGGDVAVSAMGVIYSMTTLLMMPVIGISQGVQPIIGYNFGARQLKRVKEALYLATLVATGVVTVAFLLIYLFPDISFRLFNDDPDLIAVGTEGLRIYFMMMPFLGFQIVGANYFLAVGKPRQSIFLNLSRQVVFLIPALLILPRFWKLPGVWGAQPVADVLAVVVTAFLLRGEIRNLNAQMELSLPDDTMQSTEGVSL